MYVKKIVLLALVFCFNVSSLDYFFNTSFIKVSIAMETHQLSPCPDKPNCVNSMSQDSRHAIAPFTFKGEPGKAMKVLTRIIEQQPRTRIIESQDQYLQSTFTSLIFRFIDDVEFLLGNNGTAFEVRSASRSGHADFGVNRQRIEKLRSLFDAEMNRQKLPSAQEHTQ